MSSELLSMDEGKRKARVFMTVLESLAALQIEIQGESTTNPRHVAMADKIQKFTDYLMDEVAGGSKPATDRSTLYKMFEVADIKFTETSNAIIVKQGIGLRNFGDDGLRTEF